MSTTNTNALGDTPPTVCPVCTGPCTLPGEGPTGQLGGLCTVCGWDYLVAADDADELNTTLNVRLGHVVAQAMKDAGVTRAQVARSIGVSPQTVARRLAGLSGFSIDDVFYIGQMVGVAASELLRRTQVEGQK